jgi:hypothetical protein
MASGARVVAHRFRRVAEVTGAYPPLNTLKPIVDDLWIVDGPLIRFGPKWLKMPFPTRMTIVRCRDGNLLLDSPTLLVPELQAEIAGIGRPRWIVGPNRLHHWWIPDWHAAFPDADVWLAPKIEQQAAGRIDFPSRRLDQAHSYPWHADLETLAVAGNYLTEYVFFHRTSRTLILTDLIENFEPHRLGSFIMRWLVRLGGVQDPNGGMPRDMRLSFRKAELRAAVEQLIAWNPERIVIAHGRCYDRDGVKELRRAFRWLLR